MVSLSVRSYVETSGPTDLNGDFVAYSPNGPFAASVAGPAVPEAEFWFAVKPNADRNVVSFAAAGREACAAG